MTDRKIVVGVDELRGSYFAIAVDPPWPVKKIPRKVRPKQKAELDYWTMTLDQIAAIPISDLCHPEGAYCYLWSTHKFIHKALDILEGWGFEDRGAMMWLKKTGMTPFGLVQLDSERVAYGVRGDPPIKRFDILPHHTGRDDGLAFTGVSTRHSEKPSEFYEIVRLIHPAPRLNLFARKPHQGFDNWGDQVEAEQPPQTTILEEPEVDWHLYPRESAAPLSTAGMAPHPQPPPYGGHFHCPTKVMSTWKWGVGKDKKELAAYAKKVLQTRGQEVDILYLGTQTVGGKKHGD